MSFSIKLQTNLSENNKLDKTITDIITLTGELKDGCSIIDPVIIVQASLTTLINCNYMTIESFGRKYFIRNIRSLSNSLVEISGHVDVLTTYANGIRDNSAILGRSENNWNLYLNDGSLKTYQNSDVLTKLFPSGFGASEFVLTVAGS